MRGEKYFTRASLRAEQALGTVEASFSRQFTLSF